MESELCDINAYFKDFLALASTEEHKITSQWEI